MSFVGDIFHSIGSLFGGGGQQSSMMFPQVPGQPKPAAAPQQNPQGQRTSSSAGASPSFLAAAALPNAAQSNVGGKSLLGQ